MVQLVEGTREEDDPINSIGWSCTSCEPLLYSSPDLLPISPQNNVRYICQLLPSTHRCTFVQHSSGWREQVEEVCETSKLSHRQGQGNNSLGLAVRIERTDCWHNQWLWSPRSEPLHCQSTQSSRRYSLLRTCNRFRVGDPNSGKGSWNRLLLNRKGNVSVLRFMEWFKPKASLFFFLGFIPVWLTRGWSTGRKCTQGNDNGNRNLHWREEFLGIKCWGRSWENERWATKKHQRGCCILPPSFLSAKCKQ